MEFGNYFMKYILIILSLLISFNVGASEYMCSNYKVLLSDIRNDTNQPSYEEVVSQDEFIQIKIKRRKVKIKIINKEDFSFKEHHLEIEDYNPNTSVGPSFLATWDDNHIPPAFSFRHNGGGYANLLFSESKKHFQLVLANIDWISRFYFGNCKKMNESER
jgi:hypothetical protein